MSSGFKLIIEKQFVIFSEFKALLQRLYHDPSNNNNHLWKDFLIQSILAVVEEIITRVSNKLRTFLHSHEILLSVKPFSAHLNSNQIQIILPLLCSIYTCFIWHVYGPE